MSKSQKVETAALEPEVLTTAKMYDLDLDLASEDYFAPLEESLPYAISDARGYIIIPETEIEKSLWLDPESLSKSVVSIKGGEPFSAITLSEIKISVLAKSQPFWYHSNLLKNKESKIAGQPICWYNSPEGQQLKAEINAIAHLGSSVRPYSYATKIQFILLDEDMIPLHEIPFSCNFRGSACWDILDKLKKFYSSSEKVFSSLLGVRRTSFNEKARALFVPTIKFGSEYVGKEGQKSEAIRVKEITQPTTTNVVEWCLGFVQTRDIKNLIWDTQSVYKNCCDNRMPPALALNPASSSPAIGGASDLPQLAAGSIAEEVSEVSALPSAS